MTTFPRVLLITLNWRQPEMTLECVQALQTMTYPFKDVLVIDNGSGDDSAKTLRAQLPTNVQFIALSHNLGFAGGCNVGLTHAVEQGYSYAMLVNNDAFPAPDMLTKLMEEATPDIALLSPKIYHESDPTRIWFAHGRQHPRTLDLYGTGRGQLDSLVWQRSQDADYLLGTCLLVNVPVAASVGFLDERFFMYYEDLDWALRLRQAGYRLRVVAGAHMYHRVATSSGGLDSPIRRYQLARSSVIFWRSHASLGWPWLIGLVRVASAVKQLASLFAKGKANIAKAYVQGLVDGWKIR